MNFIIAPETQNSGRKFRRRFLIGANEVNLKPADAFVEYAQTLSRQRHAVKAFFPIPVIPGQPAPLE